MAGISFVLEGATNRVDWRVAMVADRTAKTKLLPESGSTILAKRECRSISIRQVLGFGF
jgi:hypothetical protein